MNYSVIFTEISFYPETLIFIRHGFLYSKCPYMYGLKIYIYIQTNHVNIYTKPPECVDIIRRTSRGFHSWCPGSTSP